MSYKLTNICGGLIVCSLSDGSTLRLNNRQTKVVTDTEMTSHIRNLILKGLMLGEEIVVEKNTRKKK